MPLNEEQLTQIRDERKEQIVAAAVKVFARRGIVGTKMSMIAAEAGISHGLLYHYFKSKEELFTTLIEEAMAESLRETTNVNHLAGSPLDKIRAFTEAILDKENMEYFLLVHHARTSNDVPEKVKEIFSKNNMNVYVDLLKNIIVEGQAKGEIVAGDPEKLIVSYISVLSGIMVINANDMEVEGYRIPEIDLLMRIVQKVPE
ncbi:TetR/AcrR family transcriptional regulator [Cohnella silvisoli]|uniref:TetR/AcrR family transcriptional regulator n=1 Tax=Cohnella silvisoli TaxID=2873699 RepID=UPI0028151136|nr:TetR/AcrR family transcriptional regulator [Cohnella silvisoli]